MTARGYATRMRTLSLLLLVACTGSEPEDTGPAFDPDPPTELAADSRPAPVVLPEDYDIGRSYPLVIMLHGYGANGTAQDVIFGLTGQVEERDFLLVKPEGTTDESGRQFWNAATECCDFGNTGVDDVAYLAGLVEEAKTLYPIAHVAFVGHSNGGFMAYRMACERPDLVDRIGALAGTLSPVASECPATDFVEVLHMHGTDDGTIAYESSTGHLGAEDSIGFWAELGGCTGPSMVGTADHLGSVDGEETEIEAWDCDQGELELWTSLGGDHVYLSANETYKSALGAWLTEAR